MTRSSQAPDIEALIWMTPLVYRTRDIAAYFGWSITTARSRIAAGQFPGARNIGGTAGWLVPRRGLLAFLERHPDLARTA